MTRRDLLFLTSLPIVNREFGCKDVVLDKSCGIIVVTVKDLTSEEADRISACLAKAFPDQRHFVVPDDIEVKTVPSGYYHREKLGEYEIEACAGSEQELRERLEWLRTWKVQ